jgi:hypothetical protein
MKAKLKGLKEELMKRRRCRNMTFLCYSTRRYLDCYRQPNILHGALIRVKTEETRKNSEKNQREEGGLQRSKVQDWLGFELSLQPPFLSVDYAEVEEDSGKEEGRGSRGRLIPSPFFPPAYPFYRRRRGFERKICW